MSAEKLFLAGNIVNRLEQLEMAVRQLERRVASATTVVFVDGWRRTDVAASLSAATVNRFAETGDAALQLPVGFYVIGFMAALNAARTAGDATVEVYVDGAASGLSIVFDATNTQTGINTSQLYVEPLSELTVRLSSSSTWTPTTADLKVGLLISI